MYTTKTTKSATFPINYIKENFYVNYTKLFPRLTTEKFDINYINNDLNIIKTIKINENISNNISKFTFEELIKRKILIEIDDDLYAPSYLLNYIVTSTNASGYIKYVKSFLNKVETYEMKKKYKDELSKTKLKYENQINNLTESKSKYESQINELSKTKSDYENQIENLTESKSKLETNLKFIKEAHENFKTKETKKMSDSIKSEYKNRIDKLSKTKTDYENRIDELNKMKVKHENKIDKLSKDKREYESRIDDLTKSKSKYESQINDLTESKSKLESDLKTAKEEHENFKNQETKKINDLKLEMESKDVKINDLTEIKSTHEKQIEELSQAQSKYESRIDDLNAINEQLKTVNQMDNEKIKDLELIIQDQFEIINGFRYAANLLMGTSSSNKHTIRVVSKNDELYYFFGQHLDPIDVEYTLEFEETIICSQFEFQSLVNILIQKYNIKFNSKTNHIKIDITKKDQIIDEFKRELYKLNNQLSKPNPDYNTHNIQESLNEIKGEVKEMKEKIYDFVITQQQHTLLLNSFIKQKGRWRKIKQDIEGKYYVNYGTKDRETHYLTKTEIKSKLY